MHRFFLNSLKTHSHLLLAGALLGAAAAACDPKTIGNESATAGNIVCQDGDTKPAEDGCNSCTCEGGDWKCTEIGCEGCVDGDTMPAPDGCNSCTCEGGMWACTLIGCPATDGDPGACGDGIVQAGEECDDGNGVGGDGCSAMCTLEGGGSESETATDGTTGTTSGGETDSETATWGGTVEPGGVCGDGVVEGGEGCDDGNEVDGDGCSSACQIEGGGGLLCMEPVKVDPFEILKAEIIGDSLDLDVQYGGGCETHDFSLCWDGAFLESFPVQVHLTVGHDGHDDACDALITEGQALPIYELKKAYQDGYQTQTGDIVIHVEGWPQSLLYSF